MDIKPVRRSVRPPVPQQPQPQPQVTQASPDPQLPLSPQSVEKSGFTFKKSKKKLWLIITGSVLTFGIVLFATVWVWYQAQLGPVDSAKTEAVQVEIAPATTPNDIAALLEEKGVIRNKTAFLWYTRLGGTQNKLQAGFYALSPAESTSEIVARLIKGSVDSFQITFFPGATLTDTVRPPAKRTDVTTVLLNAGYNQADITAALNKKYEHPLFEGKPASADLEGYVFGETYQFHRGVDVETILKRTFDEFYGWVQKDNLVAGFKKQGLSLYEGITLASIVQRESGGDDKAQIAQIFFSRLAIGMKLGSDVTYQYIADKTGIPRATNIDSPYNTRRHEGLPPGPIAVPGLAALKAVAQPAAGDYLFFLSGDDNITYYAKTLQQHEANIANHCKLKCQIL